MEQLGRPSTDPENQGKNRPSPTSPPSAPLRAATQPLPSFAILHTRSLVCPIVQER